MKNDLHVGGQFGRLTVVGMARRLRSGAAVFRCRCECGTEKPIKASHVIEGRTRSCGCVVTEMLEGRNTKHSLSKHKDYELWCGIVKRCENAKSTSYPNYGGRGITICARWRQSFAHFLADMGPRPSSQHSIDRLDVNGNYEPGNCRWATRAQQAQNTRRTKLDGELAEGVRLLAATGLPKAAIARALSLHYSSVKQVAYRKQWKAETA